jgi:hypothetical protein
MWPKCGPLNRGLLRPNRRAGAKLTGHNRPPGIAQLASRILWAESLAEIIPHTNIPVDIETKLTVPQRTCGVQDAKEAAGIIQENGWSHPACG